jgi:hypothetical protein
LIGKEKVIEPGSALAHQLSDLYFNPHAIVIPAKAGIQFLEYFVIPLKNGIHLDFQMLSDRPRFATG